jgi:hypothetical protein
MEDTMTIDTLSLAAGALLSLLFAYVPGVKDWFDKQASSRKRLIMAGSLALVAVAVFAAGCAGLQVPGTQIECSVDGVWSLVQVFLLALVANQGVYSITSASSAKKNAASAAK